MKTIRKGSKSIHVELWQYFLRGQKLYFGIVDKRFGDMTVTATKAFQRKNNLKPDGVVGRYTYAKAMLKGFGSVEDKDQGEYSSLFPPKPTDIKPLTSKSQRDAMFGKFEYVATPTARNPEKITLRGGWQRNNIVRVDLPQMAKATNGKYTTMRFHKAAEYQLVEMWKEWEKEGLTSLIISYAGAFYPRFIRGSRKHLSNHSWGTAFDINVPWNGLGRTPALVGEKGSVRKLVKIANKWGFYWGGHFGRKDGMHFEVAKLILDPNE